ncbi:hypothetical protein JX266_006943 [Neoarthrinium moseri]|nr:hypothetical protein JX266_006943 [Neoarthrinium moseri]
MFIQYLALILLQLHLSLGAYVQFINCDDFQDSTSWTSASSLDVSFQRSDSTSQLVLHLVDFEKPQECIANPEIGAATLVITPLGGSTRSYAPAIAGPCAASNSSATSQIPGHDYSAFALSQDVGNIHSLSTIHLELRLLAINATEVACVSAFVTPEIPRSLTDALRYGPIALLVAVLAMNYCQQHFYIRNGLGGVREAWLMDTNRPLVDGVGDLLQHLQFAFLTGCLSLEYPGFFQPVVSSLNWYSIFSSSNAFLGGFTYTGVSDGIFVTNGTYGGTSGMEHMIQILGAPMAMEVWINMTIITLLLIAVAAALFLFHRLYQRLRGIAGKWEFGAVQQLIQESLRMVLTYFIQPIIAISTYQLDSIGLLPTYLISLAVLLVVIASAAYIWLFQQTPTEGLAALIVNMPECSGGSKAKQRSVRALVLVHFILNFFRGVAIGALQMSTNAQLAILILCEAILIASVLCFIPSLWHSRLVVCAVGRLIVLLLMIAFITPSTSLTSKTLVAYAILVLELVILFTAILIPRVCRFISFWLHHDSSKQTPVYNLRQLRRRSQHFKQLPQRPVHGDSNLVCVNCGLDPTVRSDSPSTLNLDIASTRSRSSRHTKPSTRATLYPTQILSPELSPSRPSFSTCDKGDQSDSGTDPSSSDASKRQRVVSGSSYTSVPSSEPTIAADVDYTVREIDFYYGKPRQVDFG